MPSARYPSNYSSYDHGPWGSLVTAQASIGSMNPTFSFRDIHDSTVAARNRKEINNRCYRMAKRTLVSSAVSLHTTCTSQG
jgi:hypothetical protein